MRATAARTSTNRMLRRATSAARPRGSRLAQRRVVSGWAGSVLGEGIPDAPNRPDVAGMGRIGLDLVADVADVDVDRALVLLERVVVVAHELEQLRPRVHASGPRGEVAQQVELGCGQADALAIARDSPAFEVDHEVAAPQGAAGLRVGKLAVRATQQRLDAAYQLSD